jgi:endonuclease YncB( thermonuclease family)
MLSSYIISNNENKSKTKGNEIRVIDGDTFIYQNKTIRLLCIDAPEKGQIGYQESTTALFQIINNQNLKIEEQGLDKYNRTLAWIYNEDNLLINKELIEKGHAKLYIYNKTNCDILI